MLTKAMKITTEGAARPVLTADVISQQRYNRFRKHLMTMLVFFKKQTQTSQCIQQYLRYLHALICSFLPPQTQDHLWPQKTAALAGLYRCQHLSSSIYTAQKSNATEHTASSSQNHTPVYCTQLLLT